MKYELQTINQTLNKFLRQGGKVKKEDVIEAVANEGFVIKLTKQNRRRLTQIVKILNNLHDDGKVGKAVELIIRCLVIPRSDKLEVGKHKETDLKFKLIDTFLSIEVKTESGDISLLPEFDKKQWTIAQLVAGQKSPYVLYSIDGTLQQLRLLPTERFFQILNEYQTKRAPVWGMLNPMSKIGKPEADGNYRIGIQVKPGNALARRRWLWDALQGEGITLKEILEMRG